MITAPATGYISPRMADTNCAPFFLPSIRTMARLKLEIGVACWNWEIREGLPHYDGSFRVQIDNSIALRKAEKRQAARSR